MFGVIKTLLGSGSVISEGIKLIDDMHTSTEEEIAAKAKAKVDLLAAYHPFKRAQRYMMLMFTTVYLTAFIVTVALGFYGANLTPLKTAMDEFYVGEVVMTIVAFYFGAGAIEGVVAKVKEK